MKAIKNPPHLHIADLLLTLCSANDRARAQQAGNVEAFTDLIVAARACAAIERQIKRAERWLEVRGAAAE